MGNPSLGTTSGSNGGRLAICHFTKLAKTTLKLKSSLLFLFVWMRLPSVSLNLYMHSFPYETKTSRSEISVSSTNRSDSDEKQFLIQSDFITTANREDVTNC